MNQHPLSPNQVIADRYRLVSKLGTGGMSTVMLAQDTVLERSVALKLLAEHLADDADFVARFRHEALSVAQLQHPNIVQVFDAGSDAASGRQFIAMEYVSGASLAELLRDNRQLDANRAVEIAIDACAALECAHRAGIVHRDVKPANLIIAEDGTTKLADFGIAKAAEHTRVTQVGSVLGTVAYLSPEQAAGGDTDASSDIYALAVCVYEMLSGKLPYDYRSITELATRQHDQPVPPLTELNQHVPPQLDRAIRVALSYDPRLRYATAEQFGQAMQEGLQGIDNEFATLVMRDPESAARLTVADMPTRVIPVATQVAQPEQRPVLPPRTDTPEPQPQSFGKSKKPRIVVALLLVAVLAASVGAIAMRDAKIKPVNQQTVQSQINGTKDLINNNRE